MKKQDLSISVGLYLYGDRLDPSYVSRKLSIMPSSSHRKGEKKITSTNHEYVTKTGVWELITETDSIIISDHINQLVSTIGKPDTLIPDIDGIQEAHIDVFLAADADEDGGGTSEFEISKENITRLASLGLPVRFTIAHIKD